MKVVCCLIALLLVVPGGWSRAQGPPTALPADHSRRMQEGLALFQEHVRPALIAHCLDCHGGKTTKGDLDLSDRQPLIESKAIEGGGKGSRLVALISHAEEPHMPMKAAKLPDATIDQIQAMDRSGRSL